MNSKKKLIVFMLMVFSVFSEEIKSITSLKKSKDIVQKNLSIYPESDEWIGDPMPYFDGETFRIFFLDDLRSYRGNGFHPWSLISTKTFLDYDYKGIVIPHSTDVNSPESALGTGSVIKDTNGIYHAFYTGHNGNLSPKEVIMHATSKDMMTWEKIPLDTFAASNQYQKDDFRDPYVFFNQEENQYWMLICTRKGNTGVIAKYTSKDLKNWTDSGVFFKNDMGTTSNLECPSLVKYKNKWYLSFSDQWPDRVVHYRVADSIAGKFIRPAQDSWDGSGFYAGRLETDGENLYVFGWTPTRFNYEDYEKYDWGGSLVSHKLVQSDKGELLPVVNPKIADRLATEIDPSPIIKTKDVLLTTNNIAFSGKGYEFTEFDKIQGINKITGKIKINSKEKILGFMFGVNNSNQGAVNLVLDLKNDKIASYNVFTNKINSAEPEASIDFKFNEGETLDYTIFIDKTVLTCYVNNKVVLSTRIFNMPKKNWGIFSFENNSEFLNLKMFK